MIAMVAIIWEGMGVPLMVIVGHISWLLVVGHQRSKKEAEIISKSHFVIQGLSGWQ